MEADKIQKIFKTLQLHPVALAEDENADRYHGNGEPDDKEIAVFPRKFGHIKVHAVPAHKDRKG